MSNNLNSLVDDDKDVIGYLLIFGSILAMGLVIYSLFMPKVDWIF